MIAPIASAPTSTAFAAFPLANVIDISVLHTLLLLAFFGFLGGLLSSYLLYCKPMCPNIFQDVYKLPSLELIPAFSLPIAPSARLGGCFGH